MGLNKTIAFPHPPGAGGPGSFQRRFENALIELGYKVIYAGSPITPDVVVIVGGTKRICWLIKIKLKRIPIVYRLDGINWLHRKQNWGFKHFLKGEYRNFNNKIIHGLFSDVVVYQSLFVKRWWDMVGFLKHKKFSIIYNGVDLKKFSPLDEARNFQKLVFLEGTIDYSPYSIKLINQLRQIIPDSIPIELYGEFIHPSLQDTLDNRVLFKGFIPRERVPNALRNSIFVSLDINPACPNTVIEAMACGSPVVAFDTGSLSELVTPGAGRIVDYGSDPWKLGFPDISGLKMAIETVHTNWNDYSEKARTLSEERYSIKSMVDAYIKVMEGLKKN